LLDNVVLLRPSIHLYIRFAVPALLAVPFCSAVPESLPSLRLIVVYLV